MQHRLAPRELLFYLVTQMSWSWHLTLTQIWKQMASPSYGCVLVWVNLYDISLCIWYLKGNKSYVVHSQLYTFLQAVTLLTSKFGTKLSALKPPAAQLLSEFGKSLSSPNQNEIILKPNSTCTTMDILRYEMYHQSKVRVWSPFPTTYQWWSTFAHSEMPVYKTYTQMHCLQNVTVDPTNYVCEIKNGSLLSIYHQNNVWESLVQTFSCKRCLLQNRTEQNRILLDINYTISF